MENNSFEVPPKKEIFKFIFTKNCNYRRKATYLKSRMQKTELENLHFSKTYLWNTKRQNMEREEIQTCPTESLRREFR